jgi:general secretion pathway protein D
VQTTVISRREEIRFVPDPNTYSLIVYANKKNQEWIANLIQQLDKRRPQVLIDVTLVEITKTDAFNYDLNLISAAPDLVSTSGLTGVIAGDITSGTILDKLSESGRSQFAEAQWDGDRFTGFYGDKHINALLTAMQSKNYGRVLAKPKILVNDNQEGTIRTTDTTYVEVSSSVPFTSGTAGDQTNLITTATDYTPYEAGLELNITPHISEGDLLRLDVSLVRSDFKPTGDATKPPDMTSSEIGTAVWVPDGSTIILGGLIRLNQNKGGKKVPILGDLPLLGGLFRGTNNSDNQSKLYVFVKAEMIRPDQGLAHGREELERLSERNRVAFERHEAEFQNYQNWPGIDPRPVDPPQVLDAQ